MKSKFNSYPLLLRFVNDGRTISEIHALFIKDGVFNPDTHKPYSLVTIRRLVKALRLSVKTGGLKAPGSNGFDLSVAPQGSSFKNSISSSKVSFHVSDHKVYTHSNPVLYRTVIRVTGIPYMTSEHVSFLLSILSSYIVDNISSF